MIEAGENFGPTKIKFQQDVVNKNSQGEILGQTRPHKEIKEMDDSIAPNA